MSSTGHLSELDLLRSQVADLSRQLGERDRSAQDLREQLDLLHAIVEGTAAESGEEFFVALVTHLTSVLKVQYAIIGEVQGDGTKKIRTLAVSAGGTLVDNFEYDLAHTPCATALAQTCACFNRDIQATFPQFRRLAELGAQSYCAVPLRTKDGTVVGLLVVMDTKPLQQGDYLQSLLNIFAPRVAVEFERRRAEQGRVQALADLHHVIEAIPDIMFVLDTQGNLVKWNRRLSDVTRYSPEELLNKPALEFVPPEEQTSTAVAIRRAFTEGYAELEGHLLTKEHRLIPYHWTGAVLKDLHGESIGITGIGRDVSDKKRAEEELQRQRRHLVQAQALAHLGSWAWDIDSGKVQWSDEQYRIFGHEPGSISVTNDTFLASLHSDDRDLVLVAINDALSGKRLYDVEYRIVRPSGEVRFIHARGDLYRDTTGHPLRMTGTVLDVTERKRAETALRDHEQLLRTVIETATDAIFMKDDQGRYVLINSAGAKVIGRLPEQIIGKRDDELFPPDSAAKVMAQDRVVLSGGSSLQSEASLTAGGGLRTFLSVKTPYRDKNGNMVGLVGVSRDITDWKRTEEERNLLAYAIDHAMEGFAVLNAEGLYTYMNPAHAQIYGYEAGELLGRSWKELYEPEYAATFERVEFPTLIARGWWRGEQVGRKKHGDRAEVEVSITLLPTTPGRAETFLCTCRDITERKHVEEALRESEQRLALAVEGSNDILWDARRLPGEPWYASQTPIWWSPRVREWLGLEEAEPFETLEQWAARLHPDDKNRVFNQLAAHVEQRIPYDAEYRLCNNRGDYLWIRGRGQAMWDEQGEIRRMSGSCQDITEHKRAEEALRLSEERFRAVFENAAVGIAVGSHTTGTGIDQVNPVFADMLGYTPEELCHLGMKGITFPDDLPASRELVSQLVGGTRNHGTIEKRYVKKDGSPIWAQTTVSSIFDKQGNYLNSIALIQDITERKQAEELIKEAERRYRTIFEQAGAGVAQIDSHTGRFVQVNRRYCEIVGLTETEMLAVSFESITHPDDLQGDLENMARLLRGEIPSFSMEKRYVRKDGVIVWVNLNVAPLWRPGEKPDHHIAIVEDISERKRAEDALREGEQAIRALHEATAAPGLSFDERMQAVLAVGCRRFKLPIGMRTQVVGEKLELVQVWAPGSDFTVGMAVPLGSTYCNTTLQGTEPVCFEHAEASDWQDHSGYKALGLESYMGTKLIGRDQVYGTVCFTGQDPLPASFSQADKDFIQLMARWISGELDRQKAEQALKHSEERYRALYDDTPTMYFTLATDGTVRSVNRFGAEQLGYRVEDLIGHSVLGVFHEQDKETVAACLSECLATPETTRHWEFRKVRKDGTIIWVRETARVGQSSSGETVVLVMCEDITERRRMEEALRKSEQYNRILFENSPIGLVLCQLDGTIVDCNERYADILGRDLNDILGKTYWELTSKKYNEHALSIIETVCATGRFGPYEKEYVHADGHLVPVRVFGSLIEKDGELCMVCSVEDITERKQAEEELRKSHSFLRQVIDTNPNYIFAKNRDGRFIMANKAVADTYGTTVDELIGRTDADFNPNQEEVAFFRQKDVEAMNLRQDVFLSEEKITNSAGQVRWLQTVKRPLFDSDGLATMVLGSATDITERKRMEESLRQRERDLQIALQEREQISQDLHDGILQSLFAVGLTLEVSKSLMSPRSRKTSGQALDQAIEQLNLVMREIRNFIVGLGSNLLEGKDLPTVLRHMLASLTTNQTTQIRLAVEDRAVQAVSAEQSLHLLRVIQEAVSNCIRHGRAQEARVSLKMLKQGVRLSIRDNGRGFNLDAAQGTGHGLGNMAARAQKIGGRFTVFSKVNEGTRIVLDLPNEASDVSR